ncbi:MAG: Rieske (2Fe-2S) protein [Actinomycetes bacterium]|jgi:nitrite reductase/ring-hydroxylating ferredoxin subunit
MNGLSRRSFASILFLSLLQITPFARAATGPTLKPSKLGQVIVWRGKKYTAIKSGKKIIWNKGVPLPAPSPSKSPPSTPSRTPSPTTTPTATASASPSPTPTGPFQFDLAASVDVPDGETRIFYSFDPRNHAKAFIITREKGSLVAFDNNCTHEACAVEQDKDRLICNCHISYFNRKTGAAEEGPASEPLKGYPVTEVAGRIIVTDFYRS